jgi:hypothetical protein
MFEHGGGAFFELFGRGRGPGGWDPTWHILKVGGAKPMHSDDGLQLVAHPVAYWKFDDEGSIAADCSGYNHDLRLVGDPCREYSVALPWPIPGTAIQFDGIDDYGDAGTFNPSAATGEITVAVWAKWNGLTSQYQGLVGKRDTWAADDMMWQIECNRDTGVVRAQREGIADIQDPAWVLPIGTWEHVAFTFDGSIGRLYRNGVAVASGPYSFGSDTEAAVVVGACEANGGNPFNGALDDARIYDMALSPEEIADLVGPAAECFPPTHTAYDDWVAFGRPDCWCYPRQCHGDADGEVGGSEKAGYYYVGPTDLNVLVPAWLVREPPFGPGIASVPNGICADFAHDQGGSSKSGYYRVGPSDLNILVANWLKKEPPYGPGVLADCPRPELVTIADLKGPGWDRYLDKIVTVEGIFVRDPLPMLVTDLDIVKLNMPMPEDHYLVLTGNNAEEIEPEEFGGAKLKVTGVVVGPDTPPTNAGGGGKIAVLSKEMIEKIESYWVTATKIDVVPTLQTPGKYAVLFSGGINNANNHIRYWNDLKFMYSTLINKCGYLASNIAVLYADGKGPIDPNTGKPDAQMPVHYSGTQANLETVFNLMKGTTTNQDFIFVFTTNHGGGFCEAGCKDPWGILHYDVGGQVDGNSDEPGTDMIKESDYKLDLNGDGFTSGTVSWDEDLSTWGGSILDDDFPNMFANLKYDKMVIVMEQCFSGGLIWDMRGSKRVIMSAAGEYEPSTCLTSGKYKYKYDEFSFNFSCAVNGADPDGGKVDADTSKDGKVSMVEAFNYATQKNTQPETLWYEDSGDGVPHSGNMPSGGDGTLGANTSL